MPLRQRHRLRVKDERTKNAVWTWATEQYDKPYGCDTSASWRVISGPTPYSHTFGRISSMRDVVSHGYERASSQGVVVMTPMTRISQFISEGSGSAAPTLVSKTQACGGLPGAYYPKYRHPISGISMGKRLCAFSYALDSITGEVLPPTLKTSSSDVARIISEASTACLSQRGRSDLNLWETLAELDTTVLGLQRMLEQTQKLIKMKSGHTKMAATYSAAGSAYLMFRYGLGPLFNDIQGVINAVEKKLGEQRITSRGKVSVTNNFSDKLLGSWIGQVSFDAMYHTSEKITVRATSLDEVAVDLAWAYGFTSKGLITLPWELLTLSFVADWFLNLGDYLGALVPSLALHNLGMCYTVDITAGKTFDIQNPVCQAYNLEGDPLSGSCHMEHTWKRRVVGLPTPKILVKTDFRFDRLLRCADAAALISQQLQSLSRKGR